MSKDRIEAVAGTLRYRPLDRLVGRVVEVQDLDLDLVEEAVQFALGFDLPGGCSLAGSERRSLQGAVAKYGIIDLRYAAPPDVLGGVAPGGVVLLRELGYLQEGPGLGPDDDPWCLGMLKEDLDEGKAWLLLFLEGDRPAKPALRVSEGYLPRPFRVVDACLTNASGVWLWKHFYL